MSAVSATATFAAAYFDARRRGRAGTRALPIRCVESAGRNHEIVVQRRFRWQWVDYHVGKP